MGSGLCLHRAGAALPASSYIIRSEATGSRTIVSQVPLAEMTEDEFAGAVAAFAAAAEDEESWWHFEVGPHPRKDSVYLPVILHPFFFLLVPQGPKGYYYLPLPRFMSRSFSPLK